MSNPVGWFEIPVGDLARAQKFYEAMLGQPLHSLTASAGGQIMQPKSAIGNYGFIALVNDTEGNLIGLHSRA